MKRRINLINKSYNQKDKEILFEQYKIITDSAEKITDKRQNTNRFYLGINSFILSFASYLATLNIDMKIIILFSVIGIIISLVWFMNINSYKKLNSAKFKVINELESYLPVNLYKKENEYLQKGYYKLTSIEKIIPIIFAIAYLILILYFNLNLLSYLLSLNFEF